MNRIEYLNFHHVDPDDFLAILNEDALRKHLIDHAYFDSDSIKEWMEDKVKIGSLTGCRIKAVYIEGALAGWCGIQPDENGFEMAIVLSKKFWGFGIEIFKTLMCWARELGHEEILFHLLDSRPEYKALRKMANRVQKTKLLGRVFTTYYISVSN